MLIPKGGGWRGMQVRGMDKFLKMLIKFHRVGKQTSIKSFKKAPPGGTKYPNTTVYKTDESTLEKQVLATFI